MTDKPKEKDISARIVPYGLLNGVAFESVTVDGLPRFLCYDGQYIRVEKEIPENEDEKTKFVLRPVSDTPYHAYDFQSNEVKSLQVSDIKIEIEKAYEALLDALRAFLDTEEHHLRILAAAILFSYFQHRSKSTPYIYCVGAPESGKSRALRLTGYLSYRPMPTVAMNYANVFRYLGKDIDAAGTIIHDEAQGIAKSTELMSIYNAGYTLGSRVARITGEHNEKQTYYFTYCIKFFAGVQLPRDHAFISRCIVMKFMQGLPQKEDITDEDEAYFRKIRKGLLVIRLLTAFDAFPRVDSGLRGRSRELYNPLLSVVAGTKWYDGVLQPLLLMDKERRETDFESKAGYVARAVIECYEEINQKKSEVKADLFVPNDSIIAALCLEERESDKKKYLASDELPFTLTRQELGKIQSDNLKGRTTVTKKEGRSVRGHIYTPAVIEKLRRRYIAAATAATASLGAPSESDILPDMKKLDSDKDSADLMENQDGSAKLDDGRLANPPVQTVAAVAAVAAAPVGGNGKLYRCKTCGCGPWRGDFARRHTALNSCRDHVLEEHSFG